MRLRESSTRTSDKRLLSLSEGASYTSLGKTTFRKWAEDINAVRHIGSRVLFDRAVIDQALDKK